MLHAFDMSSIPIVGMEKEGRILFGTWGYLNKQYQLLESTAADDAVSADS